MSFVFVLLSVSAAVDQCDDQSPMNVQANTMLQLKTTPSSQLVHKLYENLADTEDLEAAEQDGAVYTPTDMAKVDGMSGIAEQGCSDCVDGDLVSDTVNATMLAQASALGMRHIGDIFMFKTTDLKYCFSNPNNFTHPKPDDEAKAALLTAMHHIKDQVPCFSFTEVEVEPGSDCKGMSDLRFQSHKDGCFAGLGYHPSGPTEVNLGPGCRWSGLATHEILHALGFLHENSRRTALDHLQIHWENIPGWVQYAFHTMAGSEYRDAAKDSMNNEPYDINSIMHYDSYAWAIEEGKRTLERLDSPDGTRESFVMGQRYGMSAGDVNLLATSYGCDISVAKHCSSHRNGCSDSACVCPDNINGEVRTKVEVQINGKQCFQCQIPCADISWWKKEQSLFACSCPGTASVVEDTNECEKCSFCGLPGKGTCGTIDESQCFVMVEDKKCPEGYGLLNKGGKCEAALEWLSKVEKRHYRYCRMEGSEKPEFLCIHQDLKKINRR